MLLKLAMKYGEVTTGDVMIRKTGMFVFLACLLAGCDNAKDFSLPVCAKGHYGPQLLSCCLHGVDSSALSVFALAPSVS